MPTPLDLMFSPHAATSWLLAYVDPGTGSYVLQVLLAGALAGVFSIKLFWRRIVAWLQGLRASKRAE